MLSPRINATAVAPNELPAAQKPISEATKLRLKGILDAHAELPLIARSKLPIS